MVRSLLVVAALSTVAHAKATAPAKPVAAKPVPVGEKCCTDGTAHSVIAVGDRFLSLWIGGGKIWSRTFDAATTLDAHAVAIADAGTHLRFVIAQTANGDVSLVHGLRDERVVWSRGSVDPHRQMAPRIVGTLANGVLAGATMFGDTTVVAAQQVVSDAPKRVVVTSWFAIDRDGKMATPVVLDKAAVTLPVAATCGGRALFAWRSKDQISVAVWPQPQAHTIAKQLDDLMGIACTSEGAALVGVKGGSVVIAPITDAGTIDHFAAVKVGDLTLELVPAPATDDTVRVLGFRRSVVNRIDIDTKSLALHKQPIANQFSALRSCLFVAERLVCAGATFDLLTVDTPCPSSIYIPAVSVTGAAPASTSGALPLFTPADLPDGNRPSAREIADAHAIIACDSPERPPLYDLLRAHCKSHSCDKELLTYVRTCRSGTCGDGPENSPLLFSRESLEKGAIELDVIGNGMTWDVTYTRDQKGVWHVKSLTSDTFE